jgi:hypothetical protein
VRASSHVLYLLSIVESTEPKQVYVVKLDFVSERTIKDHHHHHQLKTIIRAEVEQQDRLEAMGYQSPTWRLLRALQSLLSAVQLQGESAVTVTPFFPISGRGTTRFWGKEQGPTVFL